MSEEIEFDVNLLYLQNLLFSLDNFRFDKDIIVLLNELSSLVNKKIFSSCKYPSLDIKDVKYKIYLEYN